MTVSLPTRSEFEATAPGSPDATRLTAALESQVFEQVMAQVTATAESRIAALNAAGHSFARDPEALGLVYRSTLPDGSVVTIDLQLMGSCSVTYLTAEEAAATVPPPTEEEQRFFDALEVARARERAMGFAKLTPAEKLVVALGDFEAELNNGGFEQFFINSAGNYAADVLRALKKIGARKAARFVADAFSVFPDGKVPTDRTERELAVAKFSAATRKKLEQLEITYAARAEYVAMLAGVYLADHPIRER